MKIVCKRHYYDIANDEFRAFFFGIRIGKVFLCFQVNR